MMSWKIVAAFSLFCVVLSAGKEPPEMTKGNFALRLGTLTGQAKINGIIIKYCKPAEYLNEVKSRNTIYFVKEETEIQI